MATETSSTGLGTFGAILGFLLLAVPGLVYELRRERRRPPIDRTAYREFSTVALASLLFSGAASVVMGAVAAIRPDWFPRLPDLVRSPADYIAGHFSLVARAVVIEVALACGLAWFVDSLRGGPDPGRVSPHEAIWNALHSEVPKGALPYAEVTMSNGTAYAGKLAFIDQTGPDDGRRLVLEPPMVRRALGASGGRVGASRLVLPLARVSELRLSFTTQEDLDRLASAQLPPSD